MTDLARAGRDALAVALADWEQGVIEPTRKAWGNPDFADDRLYINDLILGPQGLGWSRCSPLLKAFRWDGDFEWCGAFAAHAWSGSVRLDVRKLYFASTWRLWRYGQHKHPFSPLPTRAVAPEQRRKFLPIPKLKSAKDRLRAVDLIEAFGPREGDIVVVNGKPGTHGQHITLNAEWWRTKLVFETGEGNATGEGPGGDRYQGVVRQMRHLDDVRFLVRPGLCDLVEAA